MLVRRRLARTRCLFVVCERFVQSESHICQDANWKTKPQTTRERGQVLRFFFCCCCAFSQGDEIINDRRCVGRQSVCGRGCEPVAQPIASSLKEHRRHCICTTYRQRPQHHCQREIFPRPPPERRGPPRRRRTSSARPTAMIEYLPSPAL